MKLTINVISLQVPVQLKDVNDIIVNKLEELFSNLNRTLAKFDNYLESLRTSDTQAEIRRWKSIVDTVKGQIQHMTSRLKVPSEP